MTFLYAVCLTVGVLPVVVFLVGLVCLDSYKLVPMRTVLSQMGVGSLIALACLIVNPWLQRSLGLDPRAYTQHGAPIVEELIKSVPVVLALLRRRIGFLVDAAIWGFAVGTGFAAVENIHFFLVLAEPDLTLWTIRGFGTAVMHGGTTAMVAVTTKLLMDRGGGFAPFQLLPGLVLAIAAHSLYNHFFISPSLATLSVLVLCPVVLAVVYRTSEMATHNWLGTGFDLDQKLLAAIREGQLSQTAVGRYLRELRERFPSTVVADMLCLVRLHVELSIKAKGVMLMRKAGFSPPEDPLVESRFRELDYLEKSIGVTGLMALHPILHAGGRRRWQLNTLRRR